MRGKLQAFEFVLLPSDWCATTVADNGLCSPMAGIIRGMFSVRGLTPLSPSDVSRRSACVSGLSLIPNTTYYSTLVVCNGAVNQQTVSVTSDGGE